MLSFKNRYQTEKGFTLIELLVSVAIVAVLTGTALPSYKEYRIMAQKARVQGELHNIILAINVLEADTNQSPGGHPAIPCVQLVAGNEMDVADCSAGLRCNDGSFSDWSGPYLTETQVTDPWGTNYQYDMDYLCSNSVNGCSDNAWVRAVSSAGLDLVANNYDETEVVKVICKDSSIAVP